MKIIIVISFVTILYSTSFSQALVFNGNLEKGNYEVGFDRFWKLDKTRVWSRASNLDSINGNLYRPIRIDVWFPAKNEEGTIMAFNNYVYMEAPSPEFEELVYLTKRWDVYSYKGLTEDSLKMKKLMELPTLVIKDARAKEGQFPLILYSAGWYNRSPDNTILAEYLASHGYVVATVPQFNPGLWTWNFTSDTKSVEQQIRDLEFALGQLINLPFVDRKRIATIGYSTGGDVALLLQGRNPLIDLVIGMDASWTISKDNDVINSPFFTPKDHDAPVLILRRKMEPPTYESVIDSLKKADRFIIEFKGADHGSFSDDPLQRKIVGIKPRSDVAIHSRIVTSLQLFLDKYFKGGKGIFEKRMRDLGLNLIYRPKKE